MTTKTTTTNINIRSCCHPKGNKFFMDVDIAEVIASVYQKSFTGYKILFFYKLMSKNLIIIIIIMRVF